MKHETFLNSDDPDTLNIDSNFVVMNCLWTELEFALHGLNVLVLKSLSFRLSDTYADVVDLF